MEWYWFVLAVIAATVMQWILTLGTSYFQERGKRLATHDDIENVLDEIRAVTTETKQIEARISGTEADRQWLRNERLKVYAGAARSADRLAEHVAKLKGMFAYQGAESVLDLHAQTGIADSIWESFTTVDIIASDPVRQFYRELAKSVEAVSKMLAAPRSTWNFDALSEQVMTARRNLLMQMRKEFGSGPEVKQAN